LIVPPEKGHASGRLASFLPSAEDKGIQALEAGQTPPSAVTISEDSFVLNRARELRAILSERSEALRFCFTQPRPRIPADPITTVEDVPVEMDTIDLVATFQAILHRIRARDASLPQSHSRCFSVSTMVKFDSGLAEIVPNSKFEDRYVPRQAERYLSPEDVAAVERMFKELEVAERKCRERTG
jgi:hypothetical protein